MATRNVWTWDETLAAFALYLLIPTGQHDKNNKDVVALANSLGRTPDAVVLKLGNIKANDPMRRGKGLTHGSKKDAEIWEDFSQRGNELVSEAVQCLETTLHDAKSESSALDAVTVDLPEGKNRMVIATTRVNQRYFRNSLLENYDHHCCFTGLGMDQLLNASHIKPWNASDTFEKVSPANGLLLNALHDRAFDKGLMTISLDYRIIVSPKVPKNGAYGDLLWRYDGLEMHIPKRAKPEQRFIESHHDLSLIHI